MRGVFITWLVLNLAVVAVLGFRGKTNANTPLYLLPDMDWQPRYDDQEASDFFADGRAMRKPPAGTVAYGGNNYAADAGDIAQDGEFLRNDPAYFDGRGPDGAWVPENPVLARLGGAGLEAERLAFLERGQERYTINCAVCHGATGNGDGITSRYGMKGVANYHEPRLLSMPDGEIFNTITNGKGIMMAYGHQVKVRDRWAIVAYIRALQLSRNATIGGEAAAPSAAAAATPAPAPAPAAAETSKP